MRAGIPRIVGLPDPGIDRAVGELQQIGLGDQHRARLAQVRDHGGIARRGRGEDGVGAEARDRACDVHQILDADGDAVQGAAIAAGRELLLGPRGVGAGGFSESAHDGVELAVVAVDPLEAGFHDRRWRQRAAPVVPTERGDGAEGDVGAGVSHRAQPAPTVGRRLRSQPAAAPAVAGPPRPMRCIWGRAPQLSPHRARNPPHARGSERHRRLPVGRWSRGAWGEQSSGCHHDTQYGCPQPDSTTDLNAPRAPVPPSPPPGAERAGERWGCFFLSLRRRALAPLAWLRAIRRAAQSRRPVCFAARPLSSGAGREVNHFPRRRARAPLACLRAMRRGTRSRAPHHGAVEGAGSARQHRLMQNETRQTTTAAAFGRSSVARLPPTLREAVDAAIADGATIDEITALIRGRAARARAPPSAATSRTCAT